MKWEPLAAMAALLLLGLWAVYGPSVRHDTRPGAQVAKFNLAGAKGELETLRAADGTHTFRLLHADGTASRVISAEEFRGLLGAPAYDKAVENAGNTFFRVLHISSWAGLAWLAVGFGGQGLFFGRMAIQWVVSEKQKASVVPESFWWLSLGGGVMLFAYFAWRQDIVGVLGQTSGVVIYARNIRLIAKQRRRAARARAAAAAIQPPPTPATPPPGAPGDSPAPGPG